jgi:PAS domain S-box-containing protein
MGRPFDVGDSMDWKHMTDPTGTSAHHPAIRVESDQPLDIALAELEGHIRTFGEAFSFGTWFGDEEGRLIHVSPSFLQLLGITEQQAADFGWMDHLHPDDAASTRAAWRASIREGASLSLEYRVRARDGTVRTVLSRGVPIRGPGGRAVAWAGVNLDRSGPAPAERTLQDSDARFRTAAQQMFDPFGIYRALRDENGEIHDFEVVFVNDAAAAASALPASEQVGRRLGELLPVDRRTDLLEKYAGVVQTGQPLVLEDLEFVDPRAGAPRETRIIDMRVAPFGDGFSATWRDVTERRRRERDLRTFRERYRLLARATNDIIWDWDLQTGDVQWNDALATILGYDPSTVSPPVEWWEERIHPDDREQVLGSLEAAIAGDGDRWSAEYRFRKADGSWADVLDRGYIARDAESRPTRMVGSILDVTERRVAERELRTILDALPVAVWRADATGRILEGNAAAYAIWGKRVRLPSAIEGYGAGVTAWLADGTPVTPERWPLARTVLTGAASGPQELRLRNTDGEEKHILAYAVPIAAPAGTLHGAISVHVDVTEKKQVAGVLAEQLAHIESLYQNAPIGMCVLDRELRFVRINQRLAEMNGIPATAHLGRTLRDVLPAIADVAEAGLREVLRTGVPQLGIELTSETPAQPGVPRTWTGHWIPLSDAQGEVGGISLVIDEVTEQKAAEAVLRTSERRQRLLARAGEVLSASLAVEDRLNEFGALMTTELCDLCVIDLLDDQGQLTRALVVHRDPDLKAAARRLRSWAPNDETSARIRKMIREREPILLPELTDEVLTGLVHDPDHLEFVRALGVTSVIMVPFTARDRGFGAVFLASTNPARHFGQEDLELATELAERAALTVDNARLYEEARSAAREREDVLAAVSHDLRNPLNTIGLAASLLLEPAVPEDRKGRQVKVIQTSIRQAVGLIEDLLEASRLQRGQLAMEAGRVDCVILVEDAVALAGGAADQAGVTLETVCPPGSFTVRGDRTRLLRVLDNLLSNAVRHSPGGGTVRVSVAERAGSVRVEVEDEGPGIPAESQPHLFDRFWRGVSAYQAGAGLGLTIARGIVEAHGGRIGVESTPGQGARFWFELPTGAE